MYTNSHFVNLESFQHGFVDYPDRYSYRQRNLRKNGYKFRLYWQFKKYFDSGGTIIFDTLTYKDEFLPHVSDLVSIDRDFSCFRPRDVKEFLDRLHASLRYYKLPTFSHFICSEYGKDELYRDSRGYFRRGTKRPHYHVLLFFDGKVDPILVARLIHQSWKKGRTDNFGSYSGDRSSVYVNHNCFTNDTVTLDRLLSLCDYLSKYVLKDAKFSKKVDKFCYRVIRANYPLCLDSVLKKKLQIEVNALRRSMAEFVLISNGFGDYFLESQNLDLDLIIDRSLVRMPDKKYIWKYFKLPEYYSRKLFYKLDCGSWRLNDLGKQYYKHKLRSQCDSLTKLYLDTYLNMQEFDRQQVNSLLGDRCYAQLAEYVTYYRGRVLDLTNFSHMPSPEDVVSFYVDPRGKLVSNDVIPSIEYYYKVEPRYLWSIIAGHPELTQRHLVLMSCLHRNLVIESWKDKIIDDSYDSSWSGFDDLLKIFQRYFDESYFRGQLVYDFKEQLEFVLC